MKKNLLVCDKCEKEIPEGHGATLRLNFVDANKGAKQADLCDKCSGEEPGHETKRRGRPKGSTNKNK